MSFEQIQQPIRPASAPAAGVPIRVAMVHYRDSAAGGGSLRVGEIIANHVDPNRIRAEMVFAYDSAGPVTKDTRVPCHFLGARGPKDFAAWIRARALFKKLQPDIIHFQDGVVWLRAALARTPYTKLVHVHARLVSSTPQSGARGRAHPYLATPLSRAFLKSMDAQVCINHGARNALLELDWIARERSCVVYNSIDVGHFDVLPERAKARAELNLPADALLLGMICRLVWEKGCFDLLSIIERLPQRWHGVICGDGPQRSELQRACHERGLSDRIHFIGVHDDVRPVYASLDAYAFLSHYEPFGLVLAEAMAAGVPVFGIQSDGEFNEFEYPLLRDEVAEMVPFVRDGDFETPVPPHVLNQLAVKLSYYGARPEIARSMIASARSWVRSCFDANIQAEAMTRVYENIIAQGHFSQMPLAETYQARREQAEVLFSSVPHESRAAANA